MGPASSRVSERGSIDELLSVAEYKVAIGKLFTCGQVLSIRRMAAYSDVAPFYFSVCGSI
jgi:hypothetical protein